MGVKLKKEKLDCIKEVFYACGTHPELDLLLLDYYHPFDDFWRDYNYAWLIYLDLPDKKQVICLRLSDVADKKKLPKIKFNERLSSLKDINFYSLLYICTLYQQTSIPSLASKIFTDYKDKHNNLKSFTTYSYGRIVYRHQAAFLFGLLTGCTGNEAISWVSGMCLKRKNAIEKAKALSLEKNITLYSVWKTMTLDGFVRKANRDGAEKLLHHLIN